ncbi:choline kinase [Tahibacter aquaticus]|uniref:Choline kinase n=1 Tax=Tahibacter aquaticus TaxID=520092 RepID=A0A4R6Z6S6_9GAMM|nr:phosphocholine cytidylyltransferase family protein [Tahibacter aquaticus]TDR47471.1 choline kinase [Tahibacter aquaticus]
MHAVVLAAGCGSRMGRLTRRRPKALLRLAGHSLLDWQLAALQAAGISQVSVVAGHAAPLLRWPTQVKCVVNTDWAGSGPIASLRCARPETLGTVLLVYGDGVFHPALAQALRDSSADIAITVDRRWQELWALRFADVLADAESLRRRDGWLTEIGARADSAAAIEAQFTGLVRFSAQGWQQVQQLLVQLEPQQQRRLDTTGLLALLLASGIPIATIDVDGRWCEVDSARDLALYRLLARRSPGWSHDWRWDVPGA